MNERDLIRNRLHVSLGEIQYLIHLLYTMRDPHAQDLALQELWNQVSLVKFLVSLLEQEPRAMAPAPPAPQIPQAPQVPRPPQALPPITREELATFNGRDGRPAYVAVNGIVYDVTNHRAWSAASHFGLPAGRDHTTEFASCHAAQQWILETLPPVGRLV